MAVIKLNNNSFTLSYCTMYAAAFDLPVFKTVHIKSGESYNFDDIGKFQCAETEALIMLVRSSTGIKKKLKLINCDLPFLYFNNGDEIKYSLYNFSKNDITIECESALCQCVLVKKRFLKILIETIKGENSNPLLLEFGKYRYFEKCSLEIFENSLLNAGIELTALEKDKAYNNIRCDSFSINRKVLNLISPIKIIIKPGESVRIPLGVKSKYKTDEGLYLFNGGLSSLNGPLVMTNRIGLIDSDFYDTPNSISLGLTNVGKENIIINAGDVIGRAVFGKYLRIENCKREYIKRKGGFGSTDEGRK